MAFVTVARRGSRYAPFTEPLALLPRYPTDEEDQMQQRISVLKARGAMILGHGAMLKVLLASLALVVVALIVVALIYTG